MMSHWVWLTIALPLAGFLVNGALALRRPHAKNLVSAVGVGVLVGAFAVAAGIFVELWLRPPHAPIIVNLWRWLPVGTLQRSVSLPRMPLMSCSTRRGRESRSGRADGMVSFVASSSVPRTEN